MASLNSLTRRARGLSNIATGERYRTASGWLPNDHALGGSGIRVKRKLQLRACVSSTVERLLEVAICARLPRPCIRTIGPESGNTTRHRTRAPRYRALP